MSDPKTSPTTTNRSCRFEREHRPPRRPTGVSALLRHRLRRRAPRRRRPVAVRRVPAAARATAGDLDPVGAGSAGRDGDAAPTRQQGGAVTDSRLLRGDARIVLPTLPAEVAALAGPTSPPYNVGWRYGDDDGSGDRLGEREY